MPRRKSTLSEALSSLRIVAPSLAAFGAALGLLQLSPMVQAATNPPLPIIKPLPLLAKPGVYPEKYGITRTMIDGSGDIVISDPPPGETGCVEGLASRLVRSALNLWTTRPVYVLLNGREDFADCRLQRALTAGGRVTFTYRSGAWGGACRALETR